MDIIKRIRDWWIKQSIFWRECQVCGRVFLLKNKGNYQLHTQNGITVCYVCDDSACQTYIHFQNILFQKEIDRRHWAHLKQRQCKGKLRFKNEQAASAHLGKKSNGLAYSIYHCQHCGYWHFGHESTEARTTLIDLRRKFSKQ